MDWSPVKLSVHVRTYAFGERLIPDRLGKSGVPDGVVAETWEISDHPDARATITDGPYAGRLLHDLVEAEPDGLVGEGWRGPHFPLLDKFLDASYMLPVHLHADDDTARRLHGEPHGKTEAWHILWAAPDATILAGVEPGLGIDEIRAAFAAEAYDAVMPRHTIRAGDTVYVPGGIIHAFGPDTLIFEVQQTSDLSQSVMPTDLHGQRHSPAQWAANIDAALAELRTDVRPRPNPGLERARDVSGNRLVVGGAGPHFAIERWTLAAPHREPAHPWRCLTLSNVGPPVRLRHRGGETPLARAESCIVPAALGKFTVEPTEEGADLIACYVPDLDRDIVAPLSEAGHTPAEIAALGEIGPRPS